MKRLLHLALVIMAGVALAAPADGLAQAIPPRQVLENVLAAQAGLRDFTADARTLIQVGGMHLNLSMRIAALRPNWTAVDVWGIRVKPENGFLLPAPETFLNAADYRLTTGGIRQAGDTTRLIVNAEPVRPGKGMYAWRLEVSEETWALLATEAWDEGDGWTRLETEYQNMGNNCWVPVRFWGEGAMLLAVALPRGILRSVFDAASSGRDVKFRVDLSKVRVNTGLTEGHFR